MTRRNKLIGAWGEQVAADWLAERGMEIIARNVHTPYGEIDIVARQGEITIFLEVKTLTSSRDTFPEEAITPSKAQHMLDAAEHYATEHEIDHWQIDVMAVEGKPGAQPTLTYFENAI
jgi:putative endonuclease